MPLTLTAENGAKNALNGEFYTIEHIGCVVCGGYGIDGDDECDNCDGSGDVVVQAPVSWSTIKDIYKAAVKCCSVQSFGNPEQLKAPVVSFYRDGIKASAKWVDQQREAYDSEHGRSDPDTGSFEFSNDAQRDYSNTLAEIAEGIRSLHPTAGNPPVIPEGWKLVPIEPTEDMIVDGFESEPYEAFSDAEEWEKYNTMSGCAQAAHRAKLCWAAMLAAVPAHVPLEGE